MIESMVQVLKMLKTMVMVFQRNWFNTWFRIWNKSMSNSVYSPRSKFHPVFVVNSNNYHDSDVIWPTKRQNTEESLRIFCLTPFPLPVESFGQCSWVGQEISILLPYPPPHQKVRALYQQEHVIRPLPLTLLPFPCPLPFPPPFWFIAVSKWVFDRKLHHSPQLKQQWCCLPRSFPLLFSFLALAALAFFSFSFLAFASRGSFVSRLRIRIE